MIQGRKDANTSKEPNAEEQVTLSTTQQVRTVPVERRRTAVVTNTLGSPAGVISTEAGNYQYHRLAIGGQLQHVVTSLQVPGPSSTVNPESLLAVNSRCTVATPQEVAHILVATTTNSSMQPGVGLQNSIVTINASPQQLHALGSISSSSQQTKHEICGTVFTQPTTASSVAQRIVLNSGMSDVLALRIAQTTMTPGLSPQQQIMVLDTSAGLGPSSDVTKVHSYSLASASVSPLSAASGMQKMVANSAGQLLHTTSISHKAQATTPLRTPVKRPLVTNLSRVEAMPVNNVTEVVSCLSNINKLLSGLQSVESKALSAIPISPKPKRIKLENYPAVNKETLLKRKRVAECLSEKYRLLKIKYYIQQAEYFFLKNGGNMMDHLLWRKKCPSALIEYLRANPIEKWDSDTKLVMDVLIHGSSLLLSGSSSSVQGSEQQLLSVKYIGSTSSSHAQLSPSRLTSATNAQRLSGVNSPVSAITTVTKSVRQPLLAHKLTSKHNSLSSVYDSQIGSQEEIVERAKQEAYVMQRIANLRKGGLWSLKRLPKVQECPRNKALWDYLLEEMSWLATDFAQERKWKKAAAKKCSRMITKYFQEKEIKAEKAEKEEQMKLRKIAGTMAKDIKMFWNNIEKLVEYKQQTWLEEKRKKALDVHLNFIVDQTEKYSSWLTQGLNRSIKEEAMSSRGSSPVNQSGLSTPPHKRHSKSYDGDFEREESGSDEEMLDKSDPAKSLTSGYLASSLDTKMEELIDPCNRQIKKEIVEEEAHDCDFEVSEEEEDEEQTIEEQEKHEAIEANYVEEIKELEAENEMSIDELRAKYAAAYSSDFQMSEDDDSESDNDDMSADENGSLHSGDENSEVDVTSMSKNEAMPETSVTPSKVKSEKEKGKDENPTKEITDIAATAESFQPKGNTLSTTQVYTKVPFLLKHQLREYQHIGLDWLNAMYDKKLNGILADEMGLGKTIQTISILAHLACEKGIWGPHLIVVPTSVMLNWEMELKKWCPAFKILTYYGTPKERKQKRMGWTKFNTFHICITSYKLVVQDHVSFRRKRWKYLILDEAQHIKNFKSQRWQLLLNFQSTHRLLLTGTPLQNNLMELWSLMHFLMPNVFQSHREFREWFVNPVTGMIEGSHDYNESLIKRLHKVLRPFLLRRLKCEVEKQLPKKYEHVIMCRLSKRQRYLYDDFMSQTKTKETLATGNFMSVINILMQLRKVCNHPNMFEERQTVSPFLMEGITFHTASLVCNALDYNPFKHINLLSHNLLLADLELCLTAFAAHRVMKFKTPPHLFLDLESHPEGPPPCPYWKSRISFFNSQGSGRNSPISQVRGVVPPLVPRIPQQPSVARVSSVNAVQSPQPRLMVIPGHQQQQAVTVQHSTSPVAAVSGQPIIGQTPSGEYTVQLLPQAGTGVPVAQLAPIGGGQVVTSTQLTLQIQPTAQGAVRFSMPINISRLFQAAGGSHIVLAPSISNAVSDSQQMPTAVSSTISFSTTQNSTTNTQPMVLSTNIATATVLPQVQKTGSPTVVPPFTFSRPQNSLVVSSPSNPTTYNKPIGRVAPMNLNIQQPTTVSSTINQNHTPPNKSPVVHSLSKSHRIDPSHNATLPEKRNSLYYLESLAQRQERAKKTSRDCLSRVNTQRCAACPIYGKDLTEAVTIVNSVKHSTKDFLWGGKGYVNCLNATTIQQQKYSYFDYTESLCDIVCTPEKCVKKLLDIINRFVFVVPAVTSPSIQLHISHPCPSSVNNERRRIEELSSNLLPCSALLHPMIRNMKTQFPELRLIQYDCGKLQRLAHLLRELKCNHHRVLIFTQMTRMLDILEQFLNYHGHTYLRLDGNTKVEQRQALMERFNKDTRIFCFILSTRSGGIGVNLTGADTVIFYDSDWNPTMDAQAQDRCHRIGQTRDVHIYRLISVKTIEENILKKANQKRILGNLAIEGGNFTTAFFKTNTLHELFGLEPHEELARAAIEAKRKSEDLTESEAEKVSESLLGQALGMAEEESDLQAAKTAQAEAVAEFAEFDESIPLDDNKDTEEKSPAEEELDKLMEQLSPVEKYAMQFLESLQEPVSLEQLKLAEEEIEAQKKDWELGHLKALKEEEERRSGLLSDEDPLLCYSRNDAYNQVYLSMNGQEEMPLWAPPTPPQNENDIYIDYSMGFLYEQSTMHESRLPLIFIKKEAKRLKVDPVVSAVATSRKQKVRKDDMVNIPRSLFDRPSAAILKMRREAKLQKVKGLMVGGSSISKPVGSFASLKQPPIVVSKPAVDTHQDKPEWLVYEDWSILQVIQDLQSLPLSLTVLLPAHVPNWDLAADATNIISRVYRSSRLCRNRYESVIVPREEGKILYDTNPKKQKKTKGIYKTKNNRPMKTSQLYSQDNNGSFTNLFTARLKHICDFVQKRKPQDKSPYPQASKHLNKHSTVLGENGISFEEPLSPMQIAANRAERISREKQKNQPVIVAQSVVQAAPSQISVQAAAQMTEQQLSAAAQRQVHQQTTVTVSGTNLTQHQAQAVIASLAQAQQLQQIPQLNKASIQHQQGTVSSVSLAKSLSSGIMVNAAPGSNAGAFATISKALGQASVAAVSAQGSVQNAAIAALTSGNLRNQRATVTAVGTTTTMTVQEMVAAAAAAGQVRGLATTAVSNTSTVPAVVSVAGLTAVQLQAAAQRLPISAISPGTTVASVNQLNTQAAVTTQRNLTQLNQIQAMRQTALIRQRQQQQLKRLQTVNQQGKVAVGSGTQLTIAAAQQRAAQQQAALKSVGRAMSDAEMAQLMKRQQQLQQQKQAQAQLTTAQILAQAQQQQQQQVSITCGTATLVKTVSAPSLSGSPSVSIPVSAVTMGGVNINVSLPQGKTGTAQGKGTTATITNQQLRQIQFQQQILNQARKGGKVANLTQLAKVSGKGGGISASALTAPMNAVHIVQQAGGQAGGGQQVKGLQAAMTTVQQIQQAMKQVIPPNMPVVVTATPSLPGIQQQTLRGEPAVVTTTIKPQTTTMPSTTLTTSGVLKGSPAVVVGHHQQQILTPHQAVTLAVRAAASQVQGQVQIQVQQSPHSTLVSAQPQVISSIQPSQQQQQPRLQPTISLAQQGAIPVSSPSIIAQMPSDSTIQNPPTHVVMHASGPTLTSLPAPTTMSTNAQVVQAAMQVARQQAAAQQAAAAAAAQQKASPYTMRLRNPPK